MSLPDVPWSFTRCDNADPGIPGRISSGLKRAGRWSLIAPPHRSAPLADEKPLRDERIARVLLRRYGIVFRRLLLREHLPLAWRDLLHTCRMLEARGEIRGGRFVSNESGEHFALPEAVSSLRALRKEQRGSWFLSVPRIRLFTPGPRVAAFVSNRILYRDGHTRRSSVGPRGAIHRSARR